MHCFISLRIFIHLFGISGITPGFSLSALQEEFSLCFGEALVSDQAAKVQALFVSVVWRKDILIHVIYKWPWASWKARVRTRTCELEGNQVPYQGHCMGVGVGRASLLFVSLLPWGLRSRLGDGRRR